MAAAETMKVAKTCSVRVQGKQVAIAAPGSALVCGSIQRVPGNHAQGRKYITATARVKLMQNRKGRAVGIH
jgi:hypothetical protein